MVAFVGMIGGLALLLVGFLGPWYVINVGILGSDYNAGLFLTKMELRSPGQGILVSMGYAEAETNVQNMHMNTGSFAVIDTALYLTLLALMTAVLAVLFIAAFVFEKGKPKTMKLMGGCFAFLTFLLTLLPALYFMNTEFVEDSGGFWFNLSLFGMSFSGRPGYAWYLMLVVAVISLICAGIVLLIKIKSVDVSAEKMTSPPASE